MEKRQIVAFLAQYKAIAFKMKQKFRLINGLLSFCQLSAAASLFRRKSARNQSPVISIILYAVSLSCLLTPSNPRTHNYIPFLPLRLVNTISLQ